MAYNEENTINYFYADNVFEVERSLKWLCIGQLGKKKLQSKNDFEQNSNGRQRGQYYLYL
jgi:hypothetical protein